MKKTNKISRYFSLVELLIAMAILVIMMGFLFQFTIGAQRVFSASTSDSGAFEDTNLAFKLLDQDLKRMVFHSRSSYPGREIPMYFYEGQDANAKEIKYLAFVTSTRCLNNDNNNDYRHVNSYLVIYRYKEATGTLERYVMDTTVDSRNPYWFLGFDLTQSGAGTQFRGWCEALMNDSNCGDVLVTNIHDLDFGLLPSANVNGFMTNRVRAMRLSMTINLERKHDETTANRRAFSKLIILPFNQG